MDTISPARQYTIKEAMTLLGFTSRGAIYARVKAGQLKLNKIGSRAVRISGSSLAAYSAAVEAGTLEQLQVVNVAAKPATTAAKPSSAVDKIRGWLGKS